MEDVTNLDKDEELIYYKTDDVAIVILRIDERYVLRKKGISENDLIDEVLLEGLDGVMDFVKS